LKIANIEVSLIDHMGSDLSVVNAARVSFDKESEWLYDNASEEFIEGELEERDVKLINYLAKHKHFSPFNHAFLSFRVKAPIFVARQLVKHKFLPWNEISRRYVDSEPEFYIPEHLREKTENVKQGSAESNVSDHYVNQLTCSTVECLQMYRMLLKSNVCPEQARMVLPQNTMTEWYWSGSLGAFLDMLVLRLDPHTQKETQEVAKLIAKHVQELFPVSFKARIE
jgi:thymidylate synthase (FAD)